MKFAARVVKLVCLVGATSFLAPKEGLALKPPPQVCQQIYTACDKAADGNSAEERACYNQYLMCLGGSGAVAPMTVAQTVTLLKDVHHLLSE